jgi:outer membrane assembly lipoprotein YfiO
MAARRERRRDGPRESFSAAASRDRIEEDDDAPGDHSWAELDPKRGRAAIPGRAVRTAFGGRTIAAHMPAPFRVAALAAMLLATSSSAFAQSEAFTLDQSDRWARTGELDPASDEAQLLEARRALLDNDPSRAKLLADRFLASRPLSPLRAEAFLIRGDAKFALDDEYEALFDYEEIARRYAGSEVFVAALEREYTIAKLYAGGLRRRFFGTFRVVSTYDDAQELLIRIQERLPGSELAEQAGMTLADFYFDNRELSLAADAYDLFIQNYPKSPNITKARLRLIYSYLAGFKGPDYDATGLIEAKSRLRDLQVTQPSLAQDIGAEAILVRIYESEASKLLSTADWYWRANDAISAELFIRRLVKQYPDSVATLDALRVIPRVIAKLPQSVIRGAPDYRALRAAKLGIEWDTIPESVTNDAAAPATASAPAPAPAAGGTP